MKTSSARRWAYVGLLVGLGVSVTGNVVSTHLTEPVSERLHDSIRYGLAVLWPVWTYIGIEVLSRTQWRNHWTHWVARVMLMGFTTAVAVVVSYMHLHHVLKENGEEWIVVTFGPLAIDGTLFGCTVTLLVTSGTVMARESQTLAERVRSLRATVAETLDAVKVPAAPKGTDIGQTPVPSLSADPLGPEVPPAADPEPVLQEVKVPSPRTPTLRGSWDVAKGVHMVLDGAKDPEIVSALGVGAKSVQRLRTAVRILKADPQAEVPESYKVPAAVVGIVRDEVRKL